MADNGNGARYSNGNGNGGRSRAIEAVASFLAGLVIAMFVNFVMAPRDVVSQNELSSQLADLQRQITELNVHVGTLDQSVNQDNVDVARMAAVLNLPARPVKPN